MLGAPTWNIPERLVLCKGIPGNLPALTLTKYSWKLPTLTLIDREAVRLPSLYPYHHILSTSRLLTVYLSSLLSYISFII
jgi:hypothetical protein